MMEFEEIIAKIAFSKELNPYNDSFSEIELESILANSMDKKAVNLFVFFLKSNEFYKIFFDKLKTIINNSSSSRLLYLYMLLFSNADAVNSSTMINVQVEDMHTSNGYGTNLDFERTVIKTDLGDFPAKGYLDASGDLLDFIMNLLNKFIKVPQKLSQKIDYNNTDIESEAAFVFKYSGYFSVLKSLYERLCFTEYTIEKVIDGYYIRSINIDNSILENVGMQRFEQSVIPIGKFDLLQKMQNVQNFFYKGKYSLKDCIIDDEGCINIITENKKNDIHNYVSILSFFSLYLKYYAHLNENYKAKIFELAEVFTLLQEIGVKLQHNLSKKIDEQRAITQNINIFQCKIKSGKLVKIIEKITLFNCNEILKILHFFENDGTKSFWEYPLLKINCYYYWAILPITYVNIGYLIDSWLKRIFKDSNDKGFMFENFVKNEISQAMEKKKFYCKIVSQKNFSNKKEKEEIDLIWETKNLVLIGEIKCINFPFSARNKYYDINYIKKGVAQVKRKAKFLISNHNLFNEVDYNKKIICCVITNYPHFSGRVIENIPIIDLDLLLHYINIGGSRNILIQNGMTKETSFIPFYKNEDEFSTNLEFLLKKSQHLEKLKKNYRIEKACIPCTNKLNIYHELVMLSSC